MLHSLPRLLRNRAFRTAAALVLAFLLTTAVPAAFFLDNPSFTQTGGSNANETGGNKGSQELFSPKEHDRES